MGKIFGNIWEEDEDKKEEAVGAVRVTQSQTGVETLRQRAGRGESIFGDIWKDVPDRDYSQPAEPVQVQNTTKEEKEDKNILQKYSDFAQDTVQITGAGLAVGTERVLTGAGNVALRGTRAVVPRLGQFFYKVVGAVTPDNGYFSNLGDKFYRDMSGTYDKWVGASEQIKQKGAEVSGKVSDFYMEGVEVGGSTYEEYMKERQEGFKGADFTDPRFWAFEAYKTTVENAPLMALTYGVGTKFQVFNAATKTGKVANFLAATFGSTAFSTGMNASIEAQGAYDNALKQGKDEKQALLEAERVFNRNFGANMFYETIQNGMVFYGNPAGATVAPLWKTAAKYVTKVGVGGFTEAMQERGEDAIQQQAGNEDFNWGQAIKEVGKLQVTKTDVVSFIMGAGFQMVGSAAERKNNKVMRDIENSLAFPIQESIAAGDVNGADVFKNGKDGILTSKFAQGRIDDVAQKLGAVDPKLEKEYRANIDANNTTMGQITTLGMSLLENATKTTTDVNASGGTIVDLEVTKEEYASQVQELARVLWEGEDAPPTGAAAEQFVYEQIENNPDGVREAYKSIVANRTNFAEQAKQAAAATEPTEVQTVDLSVTDSTARIEIKQYGDQYAARFITDLGETGAQTEFDLDNLADTPDAARQIALDAIVEWVENQQANGTFSPVTQSRLEELADRSRESRGEQKLTEPKKEPEPAPKQPEPAPIATSENVNKTQFVVNVGNDPMGQRQGSEMFFDTLEEAQAFTQEVQEKTGEFLNIEERKPKKPKSEPKKTQKEKQPSTVNPRIAKEREAQMKDVEKGKTYDYKFAAGDKVSTENTPNGIVLERFIDGGRARYVIYPAGKKSQVGTYTQVYEEDLKTRGTKKPVLPSTKKTALEQERANVQVELDKARKAISADEMAEAFDAFTAAITLATKFNEKNPRSTMGNFNLDEIRAEQTVVENVIKARNESDATADAELAEALRVQYHGTQTGKELSEAIFNGTVRKSEQGIMGAGFYVTPTESGAEYFGKQVQDGNSRRVNGETPTIIAIDMSGLNVKVHDFGKQEYYDFLDENNLSPDQYNDQLQKEGFDALYLVGRGETVIFDPAKVQVLPEEGETELEGVKRGTISKEEMTEDVTDSIISRALDANALGFIRNTSNSGSAVIEVLKEKINTTINDEYENYAGDIETQGIILGLDPNKLAAEAYEQGKKIVAENPAPETAKTPTNKNPTTQRLVPTKDKQDIKPLVGKKDLKELVAAFGGRLELTVEDRNGTKVVSYEEGDSSFTLRLDALGIPNDAIEAGDTFILDSDVIKAAGTYYELEEVAGSHVAQKVQTAEKHAREAEIINEMVEENPEPDLPIHVSAEADITLSEVTAANYATSFRDPARLTEIERNDYVQTLKNMYSKLQKMARTPEQHEKVGDLLSQYKVKHLQLRKAVLSAKSRTASSAIVGGSGFNVSRNQKRMGTYDKRVGELLDFDEQFLKRAEKTLKGVAVEAAGGALEFEKAQLRDMETLQASMKEANKIFRDKKLTEEEQIAKVAALDGISEQTAREASKEYMGSRGFQSFTLTNHNGKIKRLRKKIEEMEKREGMSGEETEIIFSAGTTQVVKNPKENRLQILFESKPDEAMRTKLKKAGFIWSRRNQAWQRKLTRNAEIAAAKLFENSPTAGDSFGLFSSKPKLEARHVNKLSQWANGTLTALNGVKNSGSRAAIKKAGIGLNRIRWRNDGTAIVYRDKKPVAGKVNGFSVTPRSGQKPYVIKRKDALAYLNSREFVALQREYIRQGELDLNGDQSKLFAVEDEVVVYLPKGSNTSPYSPKAGDNVDDFTSERTKLNQSDEVKRINNQVRGIQMPELLQLIKEMGGTLTVNPDKKAGRRGFHRAGQINISPELFSDPEQVHKTLAHEIGHLNDYMPDMVSSRGTLPNRVAGTRKMLVKDFDGSLSNQGTRSKIHKELKEVSFYWRPLDKGALQDKKYMKYRNSGSELYADALSMLFVDPAMLEQMAPTFYKSFFEYLDNKPTFKKAYFELQDLLFKGNAAIQRERYSRGILGFIKGEELEKRKRQEIEEAKNSIWFQTKKAFVDQNIKAYEMEKEVRKAGGTIREENSPVYAFNEYNYIGGQIKYYLEAYIQPIQETLKNKGIDWNDFGQYVKYKRITIGDRQDVANPDLMTPEYATEQLAYMRERFGEEKYMALEAARMQFVSGLKHVLEDAYNAGIYSDSLYEKMKANPAYATFRSINHILDSNVTAQVFEQIGTTAQIQNPVDVTIRKMVEVIRHAERNKTKNQTLDFIKEQNAAGKLKDKVVPADTEWDLKRGWFTPVRSKDPKMKLVKTVENGTLVGYYVPNDVAELLEMRTTQEQKTVVAALRWANQLPRTLFITASPGFQSFSLQRDFRRTVKNQYAKDKSQKLWKVAYNVSKAYVKAAPSAYRRAIGTPDNLVQKMERDKVLSITFNQILANKDAGEATVVEGIMERFGLDSQRNINDASWKKYLKPVTMVYDSMRILGDTIETIPKIAGYTEFQKNGDISRGTKDYIRRSIGNPDYQRRGDAYQWTNNVFLFSNAIKEGIRGDIEVMLDPDREVRFRYWYSTALVDILPKIIMFGAVMGAFGDDVEEAMKKVSDYDKTNYDIIPIGVNENGETQYLRIPHDENGRLLSSIVWKLLTAADNDQPITRDIADILSFVGGQIPSLTPVISAPISTFQFATGLNPYDSFRGRLILTEDEQRAGGWRRTEPYLRWLYGELGGNTIMQLDVRDYFGDEMTGLDYVTKIPFYGNVLGRTYKESDWGVTESLRAIGEQVEAGDARRRLDEREIIFDYARQLRQEGVDEKEVYKAFIGDIKETRGVEAIKKSDGDRLIQRLRVTALESPEYDQYISAIQYRATNTSKLAVLEKVAQDLPPDEYKQLLRVLGEYKIISEPVYNTASTYVDK